MDQAGIKLVAFDVFGTLTGGHAVPGPYSLICSELAVDRRSMAVMAQTRNIEVGELIDLLAPGKPLELRRRVEETVLAEIQKDLAGITLFPDAVPVLSGLQGRGLRTALVSNLAPPYARPVSDLLRAAGVMPEVAIWSFEAGVIKPQREIYEQLFRQTGCAPQEILFVGDRADRDLWPPRELGCQARLIARRQDSNYGRAVGETRPEERIEDLRDVFPLLRLMPDPAGSWQHEQLDAGLLKSPGLPR